jgi:hypothetical protein
MNRFISAIRRHSDITIISLFTILVALFFYRTIFLGLLPVPSDSLVGLYHPYRDLYASNYPNGLPYKNFLITDPIRQQIPWRKSVIDSFKKGKLPLWDSYSFSGAPLLANIQAGAFYPLNVLFFFLPFQIAWTMLIVSQPLLAGLFLYAFLRKKQLDPVSSLIGALCFSFSGFSIAWLTWGTMLSTWLWTPLSLMAIDALSTSTKRKVLWICALILSITASFFAGHIQVFLYSVIILLGYTVWMSIKQKNAKALMLFGASLFCVSLLTVFQLIHLNELLSQSNRLLGTAWESEGFFIPLAHLIQFIAPDYFGNPSTLNYWGVWNYGEMVGYIGITGLLLALIGVSTQTVFWVFAVAISLCLAVSSPISTLPFAWNIPILSSLQPTRLLVVVDFGLSILAAYGFSFIVNQLKTKKIVISALLIGICLLGLWASIYVPSFFHIDMANTPVAKRNIVLPAIIFIVTSVMLYVFSMVSRKRQSVLTIMAVMIVAILVIDLFRFGWKFTPFTSNDYFFPKSKIISFLQEQPKPYRIMTTDDRILPPNVHEYYGIESINGYDPINSSRYEEFIAAMERGKADIRPPFGFNRIIVPKNIHSPLLNLLNVRYVLSFDELDSSQYSKRISEGKTILYEKKHSLPRVFLAINVVLKKNKQEILDELFSSTHDIKTAVVEEPLNISSTPLTTAEEAVIRSYEGTHMTIDVMAQEPRLLVVGNMHNPRWRVRVDNASATVHRVNYLFIGVIVPQGSHTIKLQYE